MAIDRDSNAPGSRIADRFVAANLCDHETIRREIAGELLSGVVTRVTDRIALESSRRISDERGLAAPCAGLLAAATSKVALAEMCLVAGLPTPRRYAEGEAIDFARGAVILRPDVTLRGKAGIRRVDSALAFEELRVETAAQSENGRVDISEWIDGADVSVLAQFDGGTARRLALWDEWVSIDPQGRIAGIGSGMPSIFEAETSGIDALLDAMARQYCESRCLVTLSLRIDAKGQPWIIEIHLGVGGDALADQLLPAALPGFEVFDSLIAVQVGQSWSPPVLQPRPRGLLRDGEAWRLFEAPDAKSLRTIARSFVPEDWELPRSLR